MDSFDRVSIIGPRAEAADRTNGLQQTAIEYTATGVIKITSEWFARFEAGSLEPFNLIIDGPRQRE